MQKLGHPSPVISSDLLQTLCKPQKLRKNVSSSQELSHHYHNVILPAKTVKLSNIMAEEEPTCKRFKPTIPLDHIYNPEFKSLFQRHWLEFTPLKSSRLEIITTPYRVCKIPNFIRNEAFMEELKNELSVVKSRREGMDLYCFEQTEDLGDVQTEYIHRLHQVFENDVRSWIDTNAGIGLSTIISMFSSCYCDTDYFLCHDDYMADRKIAYVLYLSENWTPEDGGSLDLFDTDSLDRPRNIVHSLIPEYNSLVFFEVTNTSYHQVAEVISHDKSRWTVHGWFHSPVSRDTRPPRPAVELTFHEPSETDGELSSWIMDSYLYKNIVIGIQEDLEKKSYSHLAHFLKEEAYMRVSTELISEEIKWNRVGPADRRNYEVADETTLPSTLRKFYEMFKSIEFFRLLKNYTELELVPDGNAMKPKMVIELQRWSKGSYTLIYEPEELDQNYGSIVKEVERPKTYIPKRREVSDETVEDLERLRRRSANGVKKISTASGVYTSSSDNSDDEKGKITKMKRRRWRDDQPTCSRIEDYEEKQRDLSFHPDSDDPDGSDIADSLSDSSKYTETDDQSGDPVVEPGTLDVIMQFNTTHGSEDETIDFVDPKEQDTAIIHVPSEDNHLYLVRKTPDTCRLQKYVNHYYEGYFYNLICTYYE
ncbi:prolyl 3-hydroxylase OGFOD1 [Diachasma alloeum]|uniref:prolyl 3-hydroxylase OGFOD1 n=1 Tax=Diachasma alloeum TaxID=454923 RepID=UPI00073835F6|nr:prolyl 3-hydroxylase OGFOD1 [Diachasma alloeum]